MPSIRLPRRTSAAATSILLAVGLVLAGLQTARALAAAPKPTITGTPQVGQTLTASAEADGTWQWFRCDTEACDTAIGTDSSQYLVAAEDEGYALKVRLTVGDSEPKDSDPVGPVAPAPPPPPPPPDPPEITSGPTIGDSPPPYVGNTITATGQASGATPTWQWSRCAPGCQPLAGATTQSYTVQPDDGGHQLRVEMTATNADGSVTASDTVTVPNPPVITAAPEIEPGTLSAGVTATTTAEWLYGTRAWQWLLCDSATVNASCDQITGATTRSYVVATADAGSWLGVGLTVSGNGPDAVAYSNGKFISKPESPAAPTTPPRVPFTSTGSTPQPTPVVTPSAPTLLDPFPVVRIRGRTTRIGAQLTLLSVRAPRGTRISVRCRSAYCPRSRLALSTRLRRLRVFERHLRAGVVLEIRVSHPRRIGKYTRFRIRRAAPPLRRDRCLLPGSKRPTRCPGA